MLQERLAQTQRQMQGYNDGKHIEDTKTTQQQIQHTAETRNGPFHANPYDSGGKKTSMGAYKPPPQNLYYPESKLASSATRSAPYLKPEPAFYHSPYPA